MHATDVAELARTTEEYIRDGRFEDARVCLLLPERHAEAEKDLLGRLLG